MAGYVKWIVSTFCKHSVYQGGTFYVLTQGSNQWLLKNQLKLVDKRTAFCYDEQRKQVIPLTLGERITALRCAHGLSQGDLAEKLNVSRQSISKWETNTSVPELSKLIQLSELFQISIDDLVKGEASPAAAPSLPVQTTNPTQRIIGFITLGVGLLCCVLAFGFGSGLLVVGFYTILCSILCLVLKKHAGLVIGWMTLLLFLIIAPYFTGVRVLSVFHLGYYRNGISINHIVAWAVWGLFFLLGFFTLRCIKTKK